MAWRNTVSMNYTEKNSALLNHSLLFCDTPMFKRLFGKQTSPPSKQPITSEIHSRLDVHGFLFPVIKAEALLGLSAQDQQLAAYLLQLDEEGNLITLLDQRLLPWDQLYLLMADQAHRSSIGLLQLPPNSSLTPLLNSYGGLSDADFRIVIKGWRTQQGETLTALNRIGAVTSVAGVSELLSPENWLLLQAVQTFHRQQESNEMSNQFAWATIRKLAIRAHASMDGFLSDTIVLRPEHLQLKLRKSELDSTAVIEVEPTFEGQPADWLAQFDRMQNVQDRYHITSADGSLTHILISSEVKSVLETVRRMPGRRVSGDAALAFIKNPYAMLGDDAVKVLDPEIYEQNCSDAGLFFHRFSLEPALDANRKIASVTLILSPISAKPMPESTLYFQHAYEFSPFVTELQLKLASGLPCGFWQGYELELSDFDLNQLKGLEALLERWQQEAIGHTFDFVLDLSQYGGRVIGIGIAEKVSSPYLSKGPAENWLPADLLNQLGLDGELLARWDSANYAHFEIFNERISDAQNTSASHAILPGLELSLRLDVAISLRDAWAEKFQHSPTGAGEKPPEKASLLIENNIDDIGYAATREDALLLAHTVQAAIPELLKPSVELRDHQRKGVAWLQHLFASAPTHATGCLLADDMGLGKTLQLLTFITHYLEQEPDGDPVLIIAPVSLLDNWERELANFFYSDSIATLKLYGKTLSDAKFKKQDIPLALQQQGIQNLLKPSWRNNAKIVFATYETLRDQTFSIARQHWGIIVCDEAQKIKNPAALVTQAAKAIPARFRVACTGTPVENSLSDLWCLFDFIQPGLLGSLNDFGRTYRRPIESETAQDDVALERLKKLIEPQLLRRTKAEVAKDLPEKREDPACRSLPIAPLQRTLYQSEITAYQQKKAMLAQIGPQNIAMLGLLHTLKMICAHPHHIRPEGELLDVSPKMRWLISALEGIKQQAEKVIIFTELRDIQRTLQLTTLERFGFMPTVINGDTKASSERGDSRQNLIDRFQQQAGFGVIILSTTAVGFGVNVQAANHVIHFTRTWNPAKEDQATDRAYRIGQTKDVYVYYPTITANDFLTFEATLDLLLSKKRALAGDMLNGSGDIDLHELIAEAV